MPTEIRNAVVVASGRQEFGIWKLAYWIGTLMILQK
jgi:hypothetical protein